MKPDKPQPTRLVAWPAGRAGSIGHAPTRAIGAVRYDRSAQHRIAGNRYATGLACGRCPFRDARCSSADSRDKSPRRATPRSGTVIWIQHTSGNPGENGYWPLYFEHFIREERRPAAIAALAPESPLHALDPALHVSSADLVLPKYRFSAFVRTPTTSKQYSTRGVSIPSLSPVRRPTCASNRQSGMQ